MGHAAAGVVGASIGSRSKALAIVGDGAMLMLNEISTAASYGIGAIWIVLNNASYGMISQGMRSLGWTPFETDFTRADFVSIARAVGADGVRVERESELNSALRTGLSVKGPFVIDVLIDPNELAPSAARNRSLGRQGLKTQGGSVGDRS
jgi:acetolactate synthase-1/2/3 large subunit